MSAKRSALVLQHDPDAGAGLLGGWLRSRGFEIRRVLAPEARALPDPAEHDLVVLLGSEHCALDDDLGWLAPELRLVARAHEAAVPTLGICFGAQLLARALGGTVHRDAVAEIGWRELSTARPDVVQPGPWFEWHFDTFEPPPGAEVLAVSASGVEAFALGRAVGLQFHPEVDRAIVDAWARNQADELERSGVAADGLDSGEAGESLVRRAHALFDALARHVGVGGVSAGR